jgi:hypothetical protein
MDYEYGGNWKINAVGCGAANELPMKSRGKVFEKELCPNN